MSDKPPCSWEKLANTVRQLSPLRLRNLANLLGWLQGEPPNGLVQPGEALFFWMAQYIEGTIALDADQVNLLLSTFREQIVNAIGVPLDDWNIVVVSDGKGGSKKIAVPHLMIGDGRWAAVTGHPDFLDLQTGDIKQQLDYPMLVVINYNMMQIYLRQCAVMVRMAQGGNDAPASVQAPHRRAQASVAQPSVVRDLSAAGLYRHLRDKPKGR